MPPISIRQAFELALQHHQAARLAESEVIYRQILAVQPDHPDALHLLGVIAHQHGQHARAVELIERSIDVNPNNAAAFSNLGSAYRACGRAGDAVVAYRRAIELKPDYAEAQSNLGNALRQQGHLDEAIAAFQRALVLRPNLASAHNNLGVVLCEICQLDDAIWAFTRALDLDADYAEACNNLAHALGLKGQLDRAIDAARRAVALSPDYPEAHSNLGNLLAGRGNLDEAVFELRRAAELNPDLAEVDNNLGGVFHIQGFLDEAIAAYRRVIERKPDRPDLHSNLIYALHFHPRRDPRVILEEQRRWNERFGDGAKRIVCAYEVTCEPERRIRIGYVSPEFRSHVTGRYLAPLFRCHDHGKFQVVCYSGVVSADELTVYFQQHANLWRSTAGVQDELLAATIRRDEVDILVDLTQHLAGNRLRLFARKPAPLQVSFAGYPESTGLEAIGYRISDRWLEGRNGEMAAIQHTPDEKGGSGMRNCGWKIGEVRNEAAPLKVAPERVYLIDSFWCYDPCGMEVAINELPARINGWMTFGSLNNFSKVNDLILNLWARVLTQGKNSRLILLTGFGSHRQRTVDFMAAHGVEPGRLEFIAPCPRKGYLELYHRLDIAFDPFPYGGHTTSLDALWMGVPVVSLAGERAVSRAGLSILSHLGLPELVAFSEDEYVKIAINLATDLPRLAELRRTLRSQMEKSVLMDGPHFARQIEAAYRAMWREWCAKQGSPTS